METKSLSQELVSLGDALVNQSTQGKPVNTFVGFNSGNQTFTVLFSVFDLLQYTEVANEQSVNSTEGVSQRPLNLEHASKLGKYILKGLLYSVLNKRIKHGAQDHAFLEGIINMMGKQSYYALAPIVASFRNCHRNGTNLKVVPLVSINDETAAYKVFLGQGDILWIVDGQHRRKGAELVLDFLKHVATHHKYPGKNSLYPSSSKETLGPNELSIWIDCLEASKKCTINIEVHLGLGLEEERQLFHDLNNLGKKVEKSLAFKFDGSNPINQYIKDVLVNDKFDEAKLVIHEKDQKSWTDSGLTHKELVALNAVLFLNKSNINGAVSSTVDPKIETADKFWDIILTIPNISDSNSKTMTVAAQPVVLKGIAKLFFDFFFSRNEEIKTPENQRKILDGVSKFDFSHTNPIWRFYSFDEEARTREGIISATQHLPSQEEGKSRDLGAFDPNANTFRFGSKHNDIYPIISDILRWKLNLPSRRG